MLRLGPVSLPPRDGPWELLVGNPDANRDRGGGGGFRYFFSLWRFGKKLLDFVVILGVVLGYFFKAAISLGQSCRAG